MVLGLPPRSFPEKRSVNEARLIMWTQRGSCLCKEERVA